MATVSTVVRCPHCQQAYGTSPDAIGKTLRCPQCQNTFAGQHYQPAAIPAAVATIPGLAGPPADDLLAADPFATGLLDQGDSQSLAAPKKQKRVQSARINSGAAANEFFRSLAMLIGGVVLAGVGIVASMHNYNTAQAGGAYTVWTGGIILGLLLAGKGCMGLIRSGELATGRSPNAEARVDRFVRKLRLWHVLLLLIPLTILAILATAVFF